MSYSDALARAFPSDARKAHDAANGGGGGQGGAPLDIDLAFLMDCTGSMGSWMRQCQEKVVEIVDQVQKKFVGSKMRVAFVGYRDKSDKDRFAVCSFTDPKTIKAFIAKQEATGGGDIPEDVAGGIRELLALSWGKGVARVAIHIADAPAHGTDYHDTSMSDNHAALAEDEKLEPLMHKLANKQIDFYFMRLNDSTDKMVQKCRTAYDAVTKKNNVFTVIELGSKVEAMLDKVTEAVTASMASYGM